MTAKPKAARLVNIGTQRVPVGSLKAHPKNFRIGDTEGVRESIRANGFYGVVVARPDGTILVGKHRWEAAKAEGLAELDVMFVKVDAKTALRIVLADNAYADRGGYDLELLTALVPELGDQLEGTGYDADRLAALLGTEKAPEAPKKVTRHKRVDEVPEVSTEPVTREGDVVVMGAHLLVVGDSLNPEGPLQQRFAGGPLVPSTDTVAIALVVTDPPYAIYGSASGIASDIADDRMVRPFFEQLWRLSFRALPSFGHAYVFTDWRSWSAMWDAARAANMAIKNMVVWDKGGAGLGANYAMTHELIAFAHKLPRQTAMGHREAGLRPVHKPNILRFPRVAGPEREHNAAKPVDLLVELLEASSAPGDRVLDPFAGSGSTLIAAERSGRACLTADVDPKWADVTIRRWLRLTGGKAVRDGKNLPIKP